MHPIKTNWILETGAQKFAEMIEEPTEDFQIGVAEALLFNNNEQVANDFLRDTSDSLIGKLKTIEDTNELIETATWNVWLRLQDDEERAALADFVAQRQGNQLLACQHLVWALLTSSECRFNF